jgi:hypothetical protein
MRISLRAVIITSVFLLLFSVSASADTVALSDIVGGTLYTSASDQLYGWVFSVGTPITVTSLGVYDSAGDDGLSIPHDVGIYLQSDESLLESVTVPSGTSGTLIDGFRYESVSPFALAADTYVIVMTMPAFNADTQWAEVSSFSTASGITYLNSAIDDGGSLHFPDPAFNGLYAPGFFGPNFTFTSSTVPEPSTYSALGLGLAALLAFARRRRA